MLRRASPSNRPAPEALRDIAAVVNAGLAALPFEGVFTSFTSGDTATTPGVYILSASSGAITFNLPSAVSMKGKFYYVKKTDSTGNAITVTRALSETIDGATTEALSAQYDSVLIVSDGANWHVVARI